jgi:hypothetical protein
VTEFSTRRTNTMATQSDVGADPALVADAIEPVPVSPLPGINPGDALARALSALRVCEGFVEGVAAPPAGKKQMLAMIRQTISAAQVRS